MSSTNCWICHFMHPQIAHSSIKPSIQRLGGWAIDTHILFFGTFKVPLKHWHPFAHQDVFDIIDFHICYTFFLYCKFSLCTFNNEFGLGLNHNTFIYTSQMFQYRCPIQLTQAIIMSPLSLPLGWDVDTWSNLSPLQTLQGWKFLIFKNKKKIWPSLIIFLKTCFK